MPSADTPRFSIAGPDRIRPLQPVPLELILDNPGAAPLLVNGRFVVDEADAPEGCFEVTLTVTGPDGTRLGFMVEVDGFEASDADLVLLAPGEAHTGSVRLDRYFMLSDPGEHTVRATYRNALVFERDGQRAFVGVVEAAPISIRVVP